MSDNLNSVKTGPRDRRQYHHGALRDALLQAAESLILERGVDGFSLRETARRAGVSPAAPAHHFGDSRGLLTALATRAFVQFGDALEAADAAAAKDGRIRAQGLAYVRFALAAPAKFDLMWRYSLVDREDEEYARACERSYAIIDGAVAGGSASAETPGKAPATIAAWSMVHGFVRLALDGVFGDEPDSAVRAAEQLLPAVLDHLKV
ncbi:TetR/AcrR family transcriptional regulator [Sphingosinicella terrae]|uniref:TetR/AcrR family transcriptional regulator n=1 Tax=Sphingosinicella terrae TaxID=2172047 RepID=UPI000E0D25BB|nr:TetR/AcrR family transcriptional regulator [Sphingosinicella terrae]